MWRPVAMVEASGFNIKRLDLTESFKIFYTGIVLNLKAFKQFLPKQEVKNSKKVSQFRRSSGWGTPIGWLPMASSVQQQGERGGVKLRGRFKS